MISNVELGSRLQNITEFREDITKVIYSKLTCLVVFSLNFAMFCRLNANSIFEIKFQRVAECKLELTRYRNLVIGSKFQARKSEVNEMDTYCTV